MAASCLAPDLPPGPAYLCYSPINERCSHRNFKKPLGYTKITTTMIYAHVVNAKVGMDMEAFERRMNLRKEV
jgi:hypothetical protein